jgi:hypothetical protein
MDAHLAMGGTCYWRGDLASARVHLERTLSLYNVERYRSRLDRLRFVTQDPSRKSSTPFAVTYEATTLPSGRAKLLSSG